MTLHRLRCSNLFRNTTMGGSDSKSENTSSLTVFTPEERQNIHQVFSSIIGNQKTLTEPFLQKILPNWLDGHLAESLFMVICKCQANISGNHSNKYVSEAEFGGFLSEALKGTYAERADLISLFSSRQDGGSEVSLPNLYKTVCSIIRTYVNTLKKDTNYQTWQCQSAGEDISRIAFNVLGVQSNNVTELEGKQWSVNDIEAWLPKSHIFIIMFERVWHELFKISSKDSRSGSTHSLLPCASCIDWKKSGTILDTLSVIYLNYHLPREQQTIWRHLYSNSLHGDSFSQLVTNITGKGPCVMVLRDKSGHIFGAYASESWEIKSQFYGSSNCFLFSIKPFCEVYTATGYNENFMYLNQGVQTLPNGLGLGGQLDYFGLWIDNSFNHGHSKAVPKCTTYGSPQLSGQTQFEVEALEVWGVGPEKKNRLSYADDDDDRENTKKVSALDKNIEAKAILEMAGKPQLSEGIRELEEDEPMTEEMKQKMKTIPKLL